jgi:hypothetical protein
MLAEAVKVAEVLPAATVRVAGTERPVLSLSRVTTAPPKGAALESMTVHEAVSAELRLVGVQESDETVTVAVRGIDTVFEVLL